MAELGELRVEELPAEPAPARGHPAVITPGAPTLLEGGGDAAAILLRSYDPISGSFGLAKSSELWDAVRLAHGLGRYGEGTSVAVIDDGFDLSVPALAAAAAWPAAGSAPSPHGTATALLVREVAPAATLRLYATAVGGALRTDRMVAALEAAVQDGVDVVSMSLGVPYLRQDRDRRWADGHDDAADPDVSPDDWRVLLRPDASPLADAARAAVRSGVTVVVSSGNSSEHVYTPASTAGVLSTGFHVPIRSMSADGLMEEAESGPPTYSQASGDLLVVQPPGVVGSSFACPLVGGFAALVQDRRDMSAFIATVRRAANASDLFRTLDYGPDDAGRVALVESWFRGAWQGLPHVHTPSDPPCPECALFALPLYIDFGLFRLNTRDLAAALQLLAAACAVAPLNAHAHANFGVALAAVADLAVRNGDLDDARSCLGASADHLAVSLRIRPGGPGVEARLREVVAAAADPGSWTLAP